MDASFLSRGAMPRDPSAQSARLSSQFIVRNRATLRELGTTVEPRYDGTSVSLQFHATTTVGAVPLVSPTSGQIEYGLVVKPRFDWPGIGPMLSDMGWRVIPAPLGLPLLPRSERKVPLWVLSAIVLFRIEALLNQLTRRFELVEERRSAPRGTVDWSAYAVRQMPRAQFTSVPCRFPDLRDDRALRSAIRFTLQKQFDSLAGQSSAGAFVIQLIDLCNSLIERVRDTPPHPPTAPQFDAWLRSPLKSSAFFDGLQAVQWTVDERGLGGLSDLEGLPWRMSMEQFFEAWVEAVLIGVSRRIGGTVRSGRQRQTLTPIEWEPPYVGSQKSLVPDLLLDRGETAVIIDAKYKEHWEEMQERRWGDLEDELRERHRADLLQVLAYANVTSAPHVIVCLAYPCRQATWLSLKERGRLFHRAALRASERRIDLRLIALPMGVPMHEVVDALATEFALEE